MADVNISVSVDDAHIDQIEQVAQCLQAAGMIIESTLPLVGIISGQVDGDRLATLHNCEGVQDIEMEQSYQIAPPDSEIQ